LSSEEELIKLCASKNRKAQKILFEKYASKMMGICLRYTSNTDDAKDLLQDGFVKVFMQIESFRFKSSLYTWMSRVFVNLAINKINRDVKHLNLDDTQELAAVEEIDEAPSWGNLSKEQILEEVRALPEIHRVIINLYAIDGLGHAEIAKLLNITVGSSKSRLSRARVILKEQINLRK
jgi:RNA polymerase sigma factor (sigma-70 family)